LITFAKVIIWLAKVIIWLAKVIIIFQISPLKVIKVINFRCDHLRRLPLDGIY